MRTVVPEITPTSSFRDLTLSLFYSFQEPERKMVEDILTNRDKLLKDQIQKSKQLLDQMLKEHATFAALLNKELQDSEEKMKEKCHVLEEEVENLGEKCEYLVQSRVELEEKMKENCHVLEEEVECLRDKCEHLIQSRVELKEKMKKKCHVLEEEVECLREKCEYLVQSRVELEEKMKEKCHVLEEEVETLREKCEELKRETSFACLMKEKSVALEREGELKRRSLEKEVESLRGECEKLKRDCGFMENTVSLVTAEKIQVEEEVRSQREMLENQNDVLQGFKEELEKMRESHDQELERYNELMKKKLSLRVSENLQLQEELEKSRMQSEEARKELEGEQEKVRKNYEEELKREREFAALLKMEAENLMQGRVEFEEKMKEKYDVLANELELKSNILEEEVESLRKKGEELKRGSDLMENMLSLQKRELEDERILQQEMLQNQNDMLQKGFKKELEKMRECHHEQLDRNHDMMEKKLSLGVFEKMLLEKKLEKSLMQNEEARKELEGELQKARETYEEELKRERELGALSKMEVENLMQSRVEFEEKMKEKYDVLANELELMRNILEDEVESLREKGEELKKGSDLMENMLSLQKREVEDERRLHREMLENQNDVLQKLFRRELEKMERHHEELERNHDMMKKKLSLGAFEIMQLEKKLEKSLMQNEEARKELEGELQKARETYEEELKRERDLRENNLIMAELEKMDLEEELKKSRKDFEEKIQVLEGKNLELNKKVEQHVEGFWKIRSLAELITGAYDSAISGNVRANELLGNGSDAGEKASNVDGCLIEYPVSFGESFPKTPLQAEVNCLRGKHTGIQLGEKIGCLFLENELEDGGYNENDRRLKCKRRRSINESEDDGIGLCSAYSRVESHVISSQNKEVAGCQTTKDITWRQSADMLLALKNDHELCMASVSALYRRHISAGDPSNKGVLRGIDIHRATAVTKYLVNNDPANKLSRSLLEVQQDCPYVLQTCWKLANQYKEQIFEIYQKKLDPLFCPKS